MPYARIYIKQEKKQKNVDIKELVDFWSTYTSGGDPTKKVFNLKGQHGKIINCQVLRIAETLDELHEKVTAKRSRVPKLNNTLFEENDTRHDVQRTITKNKKQKTDETNAKTSAQIETVGSILDAHRKASKIAGNKSTRKSEVEPKKKYDIKTNETDEHATKRSKNDIAFHQEEKQAASEILTSEDYSYTWENASDDSQMTPGQTADDGNDRLTQNEAPCISTQEILRNEDLDRCYKNIDDLKTELARWKKKYDDIANSKQYPLTEATGQQILTALKTVQNRSVQSSERTQVGEKAIQFPVGDTYISRRVEGNDISIHPDDEARLTKSIESQPHPDDIIDLGSGIHIKVTVYDSFAKERMPSKFVSSLAQYIWGVETLANRCVRSQLNVREPQLEDDKKGILIREFRHWLLRKRYPTERLEEELNSLSKYLNSAITSARRRLERDAALESGNTNTGTSQKIEKQRKSTPLQRHPQRNLMPPHERRSAKSNRGNVKEDTLKKLQNFKKVYESSQPDDHLESIVPDDGNSESPTAPDSGDSDSELPDSSATLCGDESDNSVEALLHNVRVNLVKLKSKNSTAGKRGNIGGSSKTSKNNRALQKLSKRSQNDSESEVETLVLPKQVRSKSSERAESNVDSKVGTSRGSTASKKGKSGGSRGGAKKSAVQEVLERSQNDSESEVETIVLPKQVRSKSSERAESNVDSKVGTLQSSAASNEATSDGSRKSVENVSPIQKTVHNVSMEDIFKSNSSSEESVPSPEVENDMAKAQSSSPGNRLLDLDAADQ